MLTIIDASHYQTSIDFARLKAAGIPAIIHKATEGRYMRDELFVPRRALAKQAGLLYGAYHFGTNGDVDTQVANFLSVWQPGDLPVLDVELSGKDGATSMSLAQAEAWVERVINRTKQVPMIYGGGNYLRDVLRPTAASLLSRCPLWWAQYTVKPPTVLPSAWSRWALWQYTDGKAGGVPRSTDGIGACDHNVFAGTETDLRALWGQPRVMRAPPPLS